MYDLRHEIRYINISDYMIDEPHEFFGFMCGILSEDNDISEIYADGVLKQAHIDTITESGELFKKLKVLSDKFDVRFVFSISADANALPAFLQDFLVKA
jgi:hypothetical protein